jgi:hypothetical protein
MILEFRLNTDYGMGNYEWYCRFNILEQGMSTLPEHLSSLTVLVGLVLLILLYLVLFFIDVVW